MGSFLVSIFSSIVTEMSVMIVALIFHNALKKFIIYVTN